MSGEGSPRGSRTQKSGYQLLCGVLRYDIVRSGSRVSTLVHKPVAYVTMTGSLKAVGR